MIFAMRNRGVEGQPGWMFFPIHPIWLSFPPRLEIQCQQHFHGQKNIYLKKQIYLEAKGAGIAQRGIHGPKFTFHSQLGHHHHSSSRHFPSFQVCLVRHSLAFATKQTVLKLQTYNPTCIHELSDCLAYVRHSSAPQRPKGVIFSARGAGLCGCGDLGRKSISD